VIRPHPLTARPHPLTLSRSSPKASSVSKGRSHTIRASLPNSHPRVCVPPTVRGLLLGVLVAGAPSCSSGGAPSAPTPVALPSGGVPVAGSDSATGAAALATPDDGATVRTDALACPAPVRELGPGITHERVAIDGTPAIPTTDDCLDVVRIDLGGHRLRVLTALHDGGARALDRWLTDEKLVAGINAGMFHDTLRSVGLLVTADAINNADDNPAFGGFLAFDPVDPASPPLVVAGRDCPDFDLTGLRARYRSISQSYRLVGCDGEAITWKDPKAYSAAAIGVDRDGRLVLLHARAPHRMRELSKTAATLDLAGAIFVEGGPEASLVVRARDGAVSRVGSFETGFLEDDSNQALWQLPNILGVERIAP